MINLLCIILLVLPSVSLKLYRDRNGRRHPDPDGVLELIYIWSICALFAWYIRHELHHETSALIRLLMCYAVSFTGHGLFFTYTYNWMWFYKYYNIKYFSLPKYIFTHLSDSAVPDRWKFWRSLGPYGRLAVYILIFTAAVTWFVYG